MTQPKNWPRADAINDRIALSARVNNTKSPLEGYGHLIYRLGMKYGINPAVAVAIMQRECQLGADGSKLPQLHNFGGITDSENKRSTCGRVFYLDRYWAHFCSVTEGIEAVYKVLDQRNYRKSGNTLADVMELYSPPFENDWNAMFKIFGTVGRQLGVTLTYATKVYYPTVALKYRLTNPLNKPERNLTV